jgi:ArsR family transcriptional regulator, lead/cadmium/zinc/bismuth-responsive transcriptional repressor
MVRRSVLEQIFKEMMNVRQRLDDIEKNFTSWRPEPVAMPESSLITLPDHLRKTYVVVASKGECDAVQVSKLTGRCRAIESNYLNQLLRMGWLGKRRVSKAVHFRPISKDLA